MWSRLWCDILNSRYLCFTVVIINRVALNGTIVSCIWHSKNSLQGPLIIYTASVCLQYLSVSPSETVAIMIQHVQSKPGCWTFSVFSPKIWNLSPRSLWLTAFVFLCFDGFPVLRRNVPSALACCIWWHARNCSFSYTLHFIRLFSASTVYKYWLVPRSTLKNYAPKLCNVARGPKARG